MSISLITNFKVNSNNPIDTRLVATGADGLTNMEYKYEGLTVYRTDTGYSYIWNGTSWNLVSDGIYGGSGSLVGDTTIDEGYVGDNVADFSNSLILSASASTELVNLSSNFRRNDSSDIEFRHSLLFGTTSGPYISFNPRSEYLLRRGGVSIGTGDDVNYAVTERFKIYNNGLIKFQPTGVLTASLNIFNQDDELIFGYNWYGVKEDNNYGSSFIKFSNDKLSINHLTNVGTVATHSVIFNPPSELYTVNVNGNLNTSGDIYLGDGQSFRHISFGQVGLGIDKNNEEVSLFNNTLTKAIFVKDRLVSLGAQNYNVGVTFGATFSVGGSLNAQYKTSIWDNTFNVDRIDTGDTSLLDNYWVRNTNTTFTFNDDGATNSVNVILNSGTFSQDAQFIFNPISYSSKDSRSTWTNTKKPYDRFFYFYTPQSNYKLIHQIEWYLSNDDQLNWKQIGHLDTGNQDNYNQESGGTSSYATRYYSQSVMVPAEMDFKVKFSFPFDYTPDTTPAISSLQSVIFTVFRSGKWRTSNSDTSISNL